MFRRISKRMINQIIILSGCGLSLLLTAPQVQADFRADILQAADTKASGEYVRTRFLQQMKKPFSATDTRKKAILIGDSHAQDFYNAIVETGALADYQLVTRYIPTVCQMYLGQEDISQFRDPRHQSICADADTLEQASQQISEADVVLLAANWKTWSAQRLPESINNLQLRPEQKLVVIGRKSYGKLNIRSYLRMPESQLATQRNQVDAQQTEINALMRRNLPPQVFVDQQKLVCGEDKTCPLFTKDLGLITFDGGHFTPQGARYVGQLLFQTPPLSTL